MPGQSATESHELAVKRKIDNARLFKNIELNHCRTAKYGFSSVGCRRDRCTYLWQPRDRECSALSLCLRLGWLRHVWHHWFTILVWLSESIIHTLFRPGEATDPSFAPIDISQLANYCLDLFPRPVPAGDRSCTAFGFRGSCCRGQPALVSILILKAKA